MSLRRLRAVTRKEFLHIIRDTRSLIIALALPFIMLMMFGYALTLDVDHIPLYVYDQDHTPQSRELIDRFGGSRYFDIRGYVDRYSAIERAVDRDRILMALVIPRDHARRLLSGDPVSVQVLIDGSDSNTASIALGYAQSVVGAYAAELQASGQMQHGGIRLNLSVDPRVRVLYNSDLKSKNFIVPGLIAVTLMIIAALLTSLTIAREWESGAMEQLLSTPLRPGEIVLGKLLAYFGVGLLDMLSCVVVGVFIFQVPLRGTVWFLFFTSCLFLFGALCWGIMISAMARTQLLAYQMGMLSSFLPAFLLSGFIYAIENMPRVIQFISYIVPARYFVNILKGIFLKGVGIAALWHEVLFLLGYAVLVFILASHRMRQKVA
ncbi:MAG TPA: ABC transporter permease [Bryobacteraceae bacterium]|nr:ABC transporter permease [Bryobacteraceae bacterium]